MWPRGTRLDAHRSTNRINVFIEFIGFLHDRAALVLHSRLADLTAGKLQQFNFVVGVHPSVCRSVRLLIRPSVDPSVSRSARLSIRPFVRSIILSSVRSFVRSLFTCYTAVVAWEYKFPPDAQDNTHFYVRCDINIILIFGTFVMIIFVHFL